MKTILEKVLEHGSLNLYSISSSQKEYKKLRQTITGDNKLNDFNPEQINEVLCTETAKKYEASDNVILIHDPSEIRKKYTKQAEHIGKVKDLNKTFLAFNNRIRHSRRKRESHQWFGPAKII